MIHIYQGFCPDELQPDSRDPDCPACRVEAERDQLRAENARLAAELAEAVKRAHEAWDLIRDIGNGQAGFASCQYCNGMQVIKQYNCGDDGPCFECANCGGGHDGWISALKVDNTQLLEEEDDIPF